MSNDTGFWRGWYVLQVSRGTEHNTRLNQEGTGLRIRLKDYGTESNPTSLFYGTSFTEVVIRK